MARPEVGGKPRRARFLVLGVRVDGRTSATLTIETGGSHEWARVRGLGSHTERAIPLALAVQMIADRAAKLDAERSRT